MIVLDTNVLSELMRSAPSDHVKIWIDNQRLSSLFVTSITQAEILYGLHVMPSGRRRKGLHDKARAFFEEDFRGRVLAFDAPAADVYAEIAATRRAAGKPISNFGCQIAAIVRLHKATLATRNTKDFEGCGVPLVNPWK